MSNDFAELFQSALLDVQSGELEAAEVTLNQLLSDPLQGEAEAAVCALLGMVEMYLGKTDLAVTRLQRSVQLSDGFADAHTNLCCALRLQGKDLEAAVRHGRRALEIRPDFPASLLNLGNAYDAYGALNEAVACFVEALKLQPEFPEALFGLGDTLRALGKLEGAIETYLQALGLRPDVLEAFIVLGDMLVEAEDSEGAISAYQAALNIDPENVEAHRSLSHCLQKRG